MTSEGNLPIEHDDHLIPIPDINMWNETMAGMFVDPRSGWSGIFYLGRWWAKPTMLRAMIGLFGPGDRAIFVRNYGQSEDEKIATGGGLRMAPTGEGGIRYTYSGPSDVRRQSAASREGVGIGPLSLLDLEFDFVPSFAPWSLHSGGHAGPDGKDVFFQAGHVEQIGLMSGRFCLDGEVVEISNAYGVRDHSRGPRSFDRHHSHDWINARFESGWGFCAFRAMVVDEADHVANAAVIFRDGRQFPATMRSSRKLLEPGTDIWAPIDFALEADGLGTFDITVERLWTLWQISLFNRADVAFGPPLARTSRQDAMWNVEQNGLFICNGEQGVGRVERSNRDIELDQRWLSMCEPRLLDFGQSRN
ncbi:hypothetical protein SAMN02927924_01126 [Sphingobium faniae]|nr:hypothetical protein SAMN02927924_01126 [Sphingobium faniae]